MDSDLGTMEGTRNERVPVVAILCKLMERAERTLFQTDFFLRGCSLGHGLVMAGGRMLGKRIFSCFLLGVSYCRLH